MHIVPYTKTNLNNKWNHISQQQQNKKKSFVFNARNYLTECRKPFELLPYGLQHFFRSFNFYCSPPLLFSVQDYHLDFINELRAILQTMNGFYFKQIGRMGKLLNDLCKHFFTAIFSVQTYLSENRSFFFFLLIMHRTFWWTRFVVLFILFSHSPTFLWLEIYAGPYSFKKLCDLSRLIWLQTTYSHILKLFSQFFFFFFLVEVIRSKRSNEKLRNELRAVILNNFSCFIIIWNI